MENNMWETIGFIFDDVLKGCGHKRDSTNPSLKN